ncbi:hypothetical protein [Palleronia caenipelagi]|uniref:Calcium-binding protein n=1 Tax=Palleronia caenipelagi TaxID=2489174 RepID=A0A547Q7Q5_9RHOB|nr:hypothetical protein [Palleronia caenipelagi]TRD22406.1 hypothetical protein FEV53_04940 [Palleronia caenipelagi]
MAAIISGFDDDDHDSNDNRDDEQSDDDQPQTDDTDGDSESILEDSEPFQGTEGDDTIVVEAGDTVPATIDLRGGDYVAEIDYDGDLKIIGGDGNDSITVKGTSNVADGWLGNDTLIGGNSNILAGHDGDDVIDFEINFDEFAVDSNMRGAAHGEAGDDVITARAPVFVTESDYAALGQVFLSGDDGSDEYNVIYELDENPGIPVDAPLESEPELFRILNFDPNEDQLRVVLDRSEVTAGQLVSVELRTVTVGMSKLILSIDATEELPGATTVLLIQHDTEISLDDIQIVGA